MKTAFLEPYIAKWQGLEPRERQLAIAGGILALVFLFYLIVWAPMQRDLARLRVTVPQDSAKLALMRAQAAQVQQLRARMPSRSQSGNMLSRLEQAASSRGLRQHVTRMEPEGQNGARLTMDDVSFNVLLSWLADLQSQGIQVENASVQGRPSPGLVNAKILLRAAGA